MLIYSRVLWRRIEELSMEGFIQMCCVLQLNVSTLFHWRETYSIYANISLIHVEDLDRKSPL